MLFGKVINIAKYTWSKEVVLRHVFALIVASFVLSFATLSYSGNPYPVTDGNDVIVPNLLIKEIPNYDTTKPVYAATDVNGWFVRPGWATEDRKKETQLIKEDSGWRAKGLKGVRFHPVQLDSKGRPEWARIENLYPMDSSFVDNSNPKGPCLKVN